jgi:hypothetical protein
MVIQRDSTGRPAVTLFYGARDACQCKYILKLTLCLLHSNLSRNTASDCAVVPIATRGLVELHCIVGRINLRMAQPLLLFTMRKGGCGVNEAVDLFARAGGTGILVGTKEKEATSSVDHHSSL